MRTRTRRSALLAAASLLAALPAPAFQAAAPGGGDFDVSASPLRPLIERYVDDRSNLARFYSIDASAARRERLKRFYTE